MIQFKIESSKAIGFELLRMELRLRELEESLDEEDYSSDRIKKRLHLIRNETGYLANDLVQLKD